MRPHNQYCPVAKAAEALGDRWSLLLIRELLSGIGRFNELERGLPGISRSVLAQRLRQLEQAGIVGRRLDAAGRTERYELTEAGRRLDPVIQVLGEWGAEHLLADPTPNELDPYLLALWFSRNTVTAALPDRRTVVELHFQGKPTSRYWLVLEPDEASLCAQYPGFAPDLTLTGSLLALYEIYLGRLTWTDAMRGRGVRVEGPEDLATRLPGWLGTSRFAPP